jgi:hypothetical protein
MNRCEFDVLLNSAMCSQVMQFSINFRLCNQFFVEMALIIFDQYFFFEVIKNVLLSRICS